MLPKPAFQADRRYTNYVTPFCPDGATGVNYLQTTSTLRLL
ncbi:hypothetical protein K0038_03054 [Pseudomonas syringae]|nr:hypothetical protein [Pseudomonas syringae]